MEGAEEMGWLNELSYCNFLLLGIVVAVSALLILLCGFLTKRYGIEKREVEVHADEAEEFVAPGGTGA